MSKTESRLLDVGRIAGVHGVKGWVKVQSFTEPGDNLFEYQPWWLKTPHGVKKIEIDAAQPHGKGYIVHIVDLDDRDLAAQYSGQIIAVQLEQLPELESEEYYWHQLQGLRVVTRYQGQEQDLGQVSKLLETGANDVLVVAPDAQSLDDRERLIPYVPGQYVVKVDLTQSQIDVDWDPEF